MTFNFMRWIFVSWLFLAGRIVSGGENFLSAGKDCVVVQETKIAAMRRKINFFMIIKFDDLKI
jgi:hypothetical protein